MMGGTGSGNHYHWWRGNKKTVVEDCLSIGANRWTREGILRAGAYHSGSWRWIYHSGNGFRVNYEVWTQNMSSPLVRLSYSWTWNGTGPAESASYSVCLETTRPRFGGLRWWFLCPLIVGGRWCARRVGKLYLPPQARHFGCRHCHDLTYRSCQESHRYDRLYGMQAANMGCAAGDV